MSKLQKTDLVIAGIGLLGALLLFSKDASDSARQGEGSIGGTDENRSGADTGTGGTTYNYNYYGEKKEETPNTQPDPSPNTAPKNNANNQQESDPFAPNTTLLQGLGFTQQDINDFTKTQNENMQSIDPVAWYAKNREIYENIARNTRVNDPLYNAIDPSLRESIYNTNNSLLNAIYKGREDKANAEAIANTDLNATTEAYIDKKVEERGKGIDYVVAATVGEMAGGAAATAAGLTGATALTASLPAALLAAGGYAAYDKYTNSSPADQKIFRDFAKNSLFGLMIPSNILNSQIKYYQDSKATKNADGNINLKGGNYDKGKADTKTSNSILASNLTNNSVIKKDSKGNIVFSGLELPKDKKTTVSFSGGPELDEKKVFSSNLKFSFNAPKTSTLSFSSSKNYSSGSSRNKSNIKTSVSKISTKSNVSSRNAVSASQKAKALNEANKKASAERKAQQNAKRQAEKESKKKKSKKK